MVQKFCNYLSENKYEIVYRPDDAEVIIFVTCAVGDRNTNFSLNMVKELQKYDAELIVAGCLPIINFKRLEREIEFDGVTGPAPGAMIVDVLARVAAGERVVSLGVHSGLGLRLPRIPANPVVSIIPINYGCLGNCSYCCVHFARGRLRSNTVDEILERMREDSE